MTVAELIERLQEQPQYLEVVIPDPDPLFGVKYFCRSTTTILAGSDGCSLDHARGWPDGWPRWRSGRSLGVAAGSEEAEDQTE